VDECWFREYKDATLCHDTSIKTGTAIHLDNNDHSITNCVVFCSLQGVVVNGSATIVSGLHVYTEGITRYPLGAVYVTAGTSYVRLEGCYFDGCPVFADDPQNLIISDSLWLLGEGDSSPGLSPIVFTRTARMTVMSAVQVVNNVAGGRPENNSFVKLNESGMEDGRSFDHDTVVEVVVDNNLISPWDVTQGMRTASTRAQLTVNYEGPTAVFIADFSHRLLFRPRRLPMVLYSLQLSLGPTVSTAHALIADGEDGANVVQVCVQTLRLFPP